MTAPTTGTDESPYVAAPTRPTAASRHSRRAKSPRKVTRYTLDLEQEQHRYLRLLALQESVEASKIMRAALYLIEADPVIRERVLDEIFAGDEASDGEA